MTTGLLRHPPRQLRGPGTGAWEWYRRPGGL